MPQKRAKVIRRGTSYSTNAKLYICSVALQIRPSGPLRTGRGTYRDRNRTGSPGAKTSPMKEVLEGIAQGRRSGAPIRGEAIDVSAGK